MGAQRKEEWKKRDAAYKALQADKKSRQEEREARKLRSGSDDGSEEASTCAETASVVDDFDARQMARREQILADAANAVLALSPQEEREARKIEKKLRDIARLQDQLDQGCALDKLQLGKIQSKDTLESHLVMRKIRAGACCPSIRDITLNPSVIIEMKRFVQASSAEFDPIVRGGPRCLVRHWAMYRDALLSFLLC